MATEFAVTRTTLQVLGTGAALPGSALTTDEVLTRVGPFLSRRQVSLARRLGQRLGIGTRHLSRSLEAPIECTRPEDAAPRLAARALKAALTAAGATVGDLTFLIGHTATPHTLLPSNTAWTADELGFSGPHVELRQACTGFAAALVLAEGLLAGPAPSVGIVGSETGSVYFDPSRATDDPGQLVNLVQMGDGAGAVVLGPLLDRRGSRIELAFFGNQGLGRPPGLALCGGGSGAPFLAGGLPQFAHRFDDIRAHGLELLRASLAAAEAAGIDRAAIDWFMPHPANGRLPELCEEHLGLPARRVVCGARELGNLGSAAIWVGLDRLRRSGQLRPDQRVLVLGAEATKYLYGGFVYVHGRN